MTAVAPDDRELVGPYRILRAIGAGGSARIDLARIDRAYGFQRHVVIKRPLEHLRRNANVAASLRREARIAGRLRHPNLVGVLDAGVHDDYDYLALEYVHGASLRSTMEHDTPGRVRALPLGAALAIVAAVARGMHAAHELTDEAGAPLGLVHRDVSPGNILLGLDGAVKLADFGIAKETRVSTLSGALHGTVTYMAPEQCQGHAFDRRADVWALGVILYELVTGARLFWADNDVASLHRVLSGVVPRPREVNPEVSEALEAIVLTAVAHAQDARFPTALALAEAIEGHAAQVGEVLGARWIARAMDQRLGRRDAPWIASATVPDVGGARGEGSLVELIAATDAEATVASFGDEADDDDGELAGMSGTRTMQLPALIERPITAPVMAKPVPSRRRWLTGVIAAGLVAGAATTAFVMTRERAPVRAATLSTMPEPVTAPPTSAATPPPAPAPTAPPETSSMAGEPRPAALPNGSAVPSTHASSPAVPVPARRPRTTGRVHTQHAEHADKPAPDASPPSTAVEPPPPSHPAVTQRPPANVEWKQSLLLPTDGSGARPPSTGIQK